MIRIQLLPKDRSEIEKLFLDDMREQDTGIFKLLNSSVNKEFLASKSQFNKLYNYLYCKNNVINRKNIETLLLADKHKLERFISDFGYFSDNDSKELTNRIFRYDTFSNRKIAYNILRLEKVSVCPYCNRQYIFTLDNNSIRPQFDHYFPKSKFPYLALSIYNLIPCCGICNQAKQALDTYKTPILYPFEEEFGDEARFKMDGDDIKYLHGMANDFKLFIDKEKVDKEKIEKIEKQSEVLHLYELYDKHKDYIKDIAWNYYINSKERIDEIMRKFPQLFATEEEVIATIYMNDIREENLGKRPLAKLTRDIYKELSIKK